MLIQTNEVFDEVLATMSSENHSRHFGGTLDGVFSPIYYLCSTRHKPASWQTVGPTCPEPMEPQSFEQYR